MSIMSELGGTSVEPTLMDVDVRLKSFPFPPYEDDPLIELVQLFFPMTVLFCFMFTAADICNDIVLEKEKKLKAGVLSRMCFYSHRSLEVL